METAIMHYSTVLLSVAALASGQLYPVFDGRIRKTADGRYEAYLVPPAAANHASFLELLPTGDLVLAWFSGTSEGANNCSIVLSRLSNGAVQWSRASLVSRRPGYSNQNPVLFYDSIGKILYLYHSQQPAVGEKEVSSAERWANVWRLESFDDGLTWTTPVDVFTKNGSFDRNRIILSLSGNWLFPIYYSEEGIENQYSTVMISSDNDNKWISHVIPHSNYLVQPSIIRPHPSQPFLLSFLRDRRAQHLYSTNSTDDGVTWSDPVITSLPNNDAAIQACVLKNGNVVLVYNPTTGPRVPLRVSLSLDGGYTWSYHRDLETSGTEFSYPSILQTTTDGYIHISYTYNRQTIKYVTFLENWIMNKS